MKTMITSLIVGLAIVLGLTVNSQACNNRVVFSNSCGVAVQSFAAPIAVQTFQPAVILPVLAAHNNFVLAGQPLVVDQTFAQIGVGGYGVGGYSQSINTGYGVGSVVVNSAGLNVLQTNNNAVAVDAQNRGFLRGGLLQRASNAIAGGRTTAVVDTNGNTTFVRQRVLP